MIARTGHTALVTGASQGLGVAIAEELARQGYDLLLVARRGAALEDVAERLRRTYKIDAAVLAADLGTPDGLDAVCEASGPSPIRVLINNAGFGDTTAVVDAPWDRLSAMIQLNITAVTRLARHYALRFKGEGGGRILNVASSAAFQPTPYFAVYGASKAYVANLAQAMNEELRGTGVSLTALCTGPVATPFHDRAGTQGSLITRLTMLQPERVARLGVHGLLRGRVLVIPGWIDWLMSQSLRVTPRAWVPWVSARLMKT